MEILVRAVGVVAVLMIALGIVMEVKSETKEATKPIPPHGLSMPGLAIEFVNTKPEVEAIIYGTERKYDIRAGLIKGLFYDYFFIVLYWLMFIGMSIILARRGPGWAPVWLGAAAALCATGAAVSDVFENLRIAALLKPQDIDPVLAAAVRPAGLAKWWFFALTTLLLSPLFLRGWWWVALLAALFAAIALVCIYGLLNGRPLFVERAFRLALGGVLVVAPLFVVWPRSVLGPPATDAQEAPPRATASL